MTELTGPFTVPDSVWVSPWPQPAVAVHSDLGPMVTIHPDGRLEFGEGYTPDEAARRFWDALRHFAPQQFRGPTAQVGDDPDVLRKRIADLHEPVQHMGQAWCGECSVRRSTGPGVEEWVALIPHPCPTIDVLGPYRDGAPRVR